MDGSIIPYLDILTPLHNTYNYIQLHICIHRVLVAAVNKSTTNPELHFFNNCFEDDFSDGKSYYHNCII